jgi:prevent-host-death family protein
VAIGDSNHKGNLAELKTAAVAAEHGIGVYKPLTEHGRCDLVLDVGGELLRVQCKYARARHGVLKVVMRTSYHSPTRGYVTTCYSAEEIDAIAVYSATTDRCYLIPIHEVEGRGFLHLRLVPPANGQKAGVRMASDYELGAVAQLVVALRWQRRGRGFESHQLHSPPGDAEVVGAHEFRDRFGLFMQRASLGERFYVTRRGKPFVVLGPADPPVAREGGENTPRDPFPGHE